MMMRHPLPVSPETAQGYPGKVADPALTTRPGDRAAVETLTGALRKSVFT